MPGHQTWHRGSSYHATTPHGVVGSGHWPSHAKCLWISVISALPARQAVLRSKYKHCYYLVHQLAVATRTMGSTTLNRSGLATYTHNPCARTDGQSPKIPSATVVPSEEARPRPHTSGRPQLHTHCITGWAHDALQYCQRQYCRG